MRLPTPEEIVAIIDVRFMVLVTSIVLLACAILLAMT